MESAVASKRRKLDLTVEEGAPLANAWSSLVKKFDAKRLESKETLPPLMVPMAVKSSIAKYTYRLEDALPFAADTVLLFLGGRQATNNLALAGRALAASLREGAARVLQGCLAPSALELEVAEEWNEGQESQLESLRAWEKCLGVLAASGPRNSVGRTEELLRSKLGAFRMQVKVAATTRKRRRSLDWKRAFQDAPTGCSVM